MKFTHADKTHLVKLELTAMIDVIFLLIIFFMTTAQFVQRARADLELPKESGENKKEQALPPMVINILAYGSEPFIVGQEQMDLASVLSLIDDEIARMQKSGSPAADMELSIRADRRTTSRVINKLGTELRKKGITHWRIATEPTR